MEGFQLPYRTRVEEVRLGTTALAVEQLVDLDEAIDQHFAEYERTGRAELFEELCPYFGVAWPAGRALAAFVDERAGELRGSRVLEIGCGLALPSLVLAAHGIAVECMDVHPDVPEFLRRNLARNELRGVGYRAGDWRTKWDENPPRFVLGADILYDRTAPEALRDFLRGFAWREFWLADPGRPYHGAFLELARAEGWGVAEEGREGVGIFRIVRQLK